MADTSKVMPWELPEEFLQRMRKLLSDDEYTAFLSSYRQKRHYSLRINPLKTVREKALGLLRESAAACSGTETNDLQQEDCLQPVPWEPDGAYYPEEFRPGRLPWHEAGMYYIQEASAMAPAVLCGAKPGERVLDLCAAPGGKSSKLAACLQGRGILIANEIHPERAKVLSSNLERLGVRNALVTNESPQKLASCFPLFFDRITVDAPCSGEGMFRKEEDALRHWSPDNVRMCAERQSEILEEAASMLRPGGTMVYSTCTFSPEENEGVVCRFLTGHPDFSVVNIFDLTDIKAREWGFAGGRSEWVPGQDQSDQDQIGEYSQSGSTERNTEVLLRQICGTVRLWPHLLEGEGHFVALLQKDGSRSETDGVSARKEECGENTGVRALEFNRGDGKNSRKKEKGKGNNKGQRKGKKQDSNLSVNEAQGMWEEFCRESLLPWDSPGSVMSISADRLCMFGNKLFALPVPASSLSLGGIRVLRAGLELGTVARGRFEPAHALAMALCKEEVRRCVELDGKSPKAYAWLRGESVSMDETALKGWTLVQVDGCSIGWAKANGGILKNHYPKGIRKGSNYREK